MSETRKQRNPEQLIAETEERLANLRLRQAKKDAQSNPALAPLFEELEEHRKTIREAKKGLGKGPQSFDSRVAKHELWIAKIEAERASAESDMQEAEEAKLEIENRITATLSTLSSPSNTNSNEASA